jgi:hypothetical protein
MPAHERYRRSLGAASADVDGDLVLVSPADRRCFSLNPSAAAVWNALPAADRDGVSFAELIDTLVNDFDVDTARCAAETTALLGSMVAAGVVTVTP